MIKAFLAKIRPASTKKIQEPTGPYSLSSMMKRVGVMRKGNKKAGICMEKMLVNLNPAVKRPC